MTETRAVPSEVTSQVSDGARTKGGPLAGVHWLHKVRGGIVVGDIVMMSLTFVLAQYIWFGGISESVANDQIPLSYLQISLLVGGLWLLTLSAQRSRSERVLAVGGEEYRRVVNATFLAFGSSAILAYLFEIRLSRGFFLVALPLGIVMLCIGRWIARRVLDHYRTRGRCMSDAIVMGAPADVRRLVAELEPNREAGYRAVGYSLTSGTGGSPENPAWTSVPEIATWDVVDRVARDGVRAVIVAGELPGGRDGIRRLGWELEGSGAELILVSRLTDVAGPRMHLRPVQGLPLVHVTLPQYSGPAHALKRAFDVVFSAAVLLVLSPVFLVLAVMIKAGDRGPVFFRQERVGTKGSTFRMVKFRSMRVDAEAMKDRLMEQNEGSGPLFKLKHDPRVTRVGAVLRKYSLDELPQFWNVLVGDMSVVGPRPPLASEVAEYDDDTTRRLLIKPGITGLWQVGGRSDLSWDESVRLDLSYVENWSFTGDLVIIAKTLRTMLRRDGAY